VGIRLAVLLTAVAALSACTQGHCRRKSDAPKPAEGVGTDSTGAAGANKLNSDRVLVYKYDGSLQCGMGKAVSLDAMAKELSGIPIHSSVKKKDGLMHIQVCGSITGTANVYEIPAANLKQAEGKGFKKWSFE
jgi:hypothetical protein